MHKAHIQRQQQQQKHTPNKRTYDKLSHIVLHKSFDEIN